MNKYLIYCISLRPRLGVPWRISYTVLLWNGRVTVEFRAAHAPRTRQGLIAAEQYKGAGPPPTMRRPGQMLREQSQPWGLGEEVGFGGVGREGGDAEAAVGGGQGQVAGEAGQDVAVADPLGGKGGVDSRRVYGVAREDESAVAVFGLGEYGA